MSTYQPKKKGNELESAVRAIEEAILRDAPGYAEGLFKIEGNRIIVSNGVRHEIDLFVTVSLSPGYESVFIFECKNWDAKVGKNELIIFSEKISVIGAQRGFFVAKDFTKDAKAQAKRNPRIQLLTATFLEPLSRVTFPRFHAMNISASNADVKIAGFGPDLKFRKIDLSGKFITVKGSTRPAEEFISEKVNQLRDTVLSHTPTQTFGDGFHEVPFDTTLSFDQGEAVLDGTPVKSIEISGKATIEIAIGSILSIYEVQSRGRMLKVGAAVQGFEIQMDLIEIEPKPALSP